VATDDPQLRFRHGWLTADAQEALGQNDAARNTLQQLRTEFPESARLRRRLDSTSRNAS
jgi:tetratricopeptide repeat protein